MHIVYKKGISVILVMLMVLGGLNGVFVGGERAYAADGFAAGTGTMDDPYQIATAAQLDMIRNQLGANKYFKLIGNIDLTDYLSASGAGYNGGAGWVPIGSYYNRFNGNLDGNGFKIMNLIISLPEGDSVGFFGITGESSTITNIILENINVEGLMSVGSLVAQNYGTISNSTVTGSVYTDPDNVGINKGNNIGGFVGINGDGGTINSSYSAVNVSGVVVVNSNSGFSIGGFVGFNNQGTINNSYATGNVSGNGEVGSLVGSNSQGTITNSYATGFVTGNDSVGGLVGNNYSGSINNSFYDSDTTGQPEGDTGKGVGKSTSEMQTDSTFTGWSFSSDWYIVPGQYPQLWTVTLTQGTDPGTTKLNYVSDGMEYSIDGVQYISIIGTSIDNIVVIAGDTISIRVTGTSPLSPKTLTAGQTDIKPVEFAGGNGEEATPYQIATVAQLNEVRNNLREDVYFKLTADINLSGHTNWVPLGDYTSNYNNIFYGNIDGNGFRIMNLNINSTTDYAGLFGYAGSGSEITNIILENISVQAGETIGGLVGRNEGTISNSSVTGTVYGRYNVGGLVGGNEYSGTISNSHATVSVNGDYNVVGGLVGQNYEGTISTSYATGNVSGDTEVGGLVGRNYYGTISTSYAVGNVSGDTEVGGLVGYDEFGTISSSSFYDSDTTTQSDIDKGVGKSTEDMKDQNTFTDWNFDSDWYMLLGQYPQLWAFTALTPGTNNGTTKLNNIATGMEYSLDGDIYTAITGTSEDNIHVNVGDTISVRVAATPSSARTLTVDITNIKPVVVIATAAVAGVTAPVTGATPVTIVTETTYYTGTVIWSSSPVTFAASTAYTATITITPKAGYTLTGVGADFFTVFGATTTNDADSGVVTAVFPATAAAPSSNADLSGLTLSSGTLSPVFATGTTAYSASVANSVASLTLTANKADSNATVTVNGTTVVSGQSSQDISLNVGSNTITVVVTAQNDITKTYTVTVTRSTAPTPTPTPTPAVTPAPKVTSTVGNITIPAGSAGEVSLGDAITIQIPADASGKEIKLTIKEVLNAQGLLTRQEVLASPIYEILKNFSENFTNPVTLTFAFNPASLKSNQKAVVFYYDEVKKVWVVVGGKVSGNKITVNVNHFTKFTVMAVDQVEEVPTVPTTDVSFSDISGHWAEAGIMQAVNSGIVKGYLDGTFKPGKTVTRAEFSVMLMNALKPQGEGAELTFTDSAKIGSWAQKAVAQAVQAGIINGYANGTFGPNEEITRAEMAVMLTKALGQSIEANAVTGFADDEDIPAWAKGSIAYMKQDGVMNGKGDNEFAPDDHATRAEAVAVLLNMVAQKSK